MNSLILKVFKQVKFITLGHALVTEGPIFRRVFEDASIGKSRQSVQAVLHRIKGRAQTLVLDDMEDFSTHEAFAFYLCGSGERRIDPIDQRQWEAGNPTKP